MAAATESTHRTVAPALSRKVRISSRHSRSSSTMRTRAPARPARAPAGRPSNVAADKAGELGFLVGGRTSGGGFNGRLPWRNRGGRDRPAPPVPHRAEGVGARNCVATVAPRYGRREWLLSTADRSSYGDTLRTVGGAPDDPLGEATCTGPGRARSRPHPS